MTNNNVFQNNECCQAFADSYEVSSLPAMREIERAVLGCDYGGTSWTTRAQAEQLLEVLDLQAGDHLLDIGAGSGWPGIFLADASGCNVTLMDMPLNALIKAKQRAHADGIGDRVTTIAGSGAALPFGDATFRAISHSDVLCCLPEKLEMLKECRRIATDDASMFFSVIAIAPGLSRADHSRAVEAGPPYVDAPGGYADLFSESGWRVIRHIDCTSEHRKSLGALVSAFEKSEALAAALGRDVVIEECERRLEQIDVIDAGLMVREIFLATAN